MILKPRLVICDEKGHVVDGDRITLYYGASDSVICGATLSIRELLATLD